MRIQSLTTLSLAAAAAGALACSESTAPKAGAPVSVSFSTTAATGATLSRSVDPSFASSTADALVITKAQLVIARVELVRAGATCASDVPSGDDHGDDDESECAELQLAPSLIDLPVDGTIVNKLDFTIPEGTYSALEARLRPIRAGNDGGPASTAFLAAHPDLNGVSVIVEGTLNGNPFSYKGAVSTGIEHTFSPPLTVGATPLSLTVNADLSTWFRTSAGTIIDPNTANPGGANAQLVADNIRRSFRAFRDDDHNGHDDDDGPGHG
jgi:hypothetical protein